MVESYTVPTVVYSGEHEGVMKAILISPNPITVTDAVYELSIENPDYTFNYTYADKSTGSIPAHFAFGYSEEDEAYLRRGNRYN